MSETIEEDLFGLSVEDVAQERGYQKYEFCSAVDCFNFNKGKCDYEGKTPIVCSMTAKEFHHLLIENGFKIVKED